MGNPLIAQMSDDQLIAEWDGARQHLSLLENEVRRRFIALRAHKATMARQHAVETGPQPVSRADRALAAAAIPSITPKRAVARENQRAIIRSEDQFKVGVAAIRELGGRGA